MGSGAGTSSGAVSEPIAIIGIGCRFPGAPDPAAFWQLLRDGADAVTEVPPERLDLEAGESGRSTPCGIRRWGGFLQDIDRFDAPFFGISPREAVRMDPQQRLLLEVVWEALEDAGQRRPGAERRSGLFVGICSDEYRYLGAGDRERLDLYWSTGGSRGAAAGRVAHACGLRGPSLAVDSDRSASLVAVHLACQSLRSGECATAVAAGVHLILGPELDLALSRAGLLAADGRSKAFDRSADGFARSDGVGAVVLKPLAPALADGDPIRAVIRGSAVNHDGGRGEAGAGGFLLEPSQAGQEEVLQDAYRNAGLSPGEIDYVETHGTGTPVGDRVEARALGAVLAAGREPGRRCAIGSVKTNIGHTEAAAGIAGLIKVALCLEHRQIPPSLHCREPSPEIPWQALPIVVQRRLGAWPSGVRPARAGVSSFGIAGTNAHVVLEEAPERPASGEARDRRQRHRWQRERYWLEPVAEADTDHRKEPEAAGAPEARPGRSETVRRAAAEVLELTPEALDLDLPLTRLGLDSLMATELAQSLEAHLGARVSAGALLDGLSIRGLEQRLRGEPEKPPADESPSLAAVPADREHPLTHGQKALWFLHQLAPDSAAYHLAFAFELRSAVDVDDLRRAFVALTERHPALRTTLAAPGGEPVGVEHERLGPGWSEHDAAGWTDAALERRLRREAYAPFDLEAGPLLRVALFERSPEDRVLLVVFSHVIADFWSVGNLFQELGALYSRAGGSGDPPSLEPLEVSYGAWLRRQRELLAGSEGERHWAYWRRQLRGCRGDLALATDRPRPPVQTYRGARQRLLLEAGVCRRLRSFVLARDATLFSVLLAAFEALLHRYSGQRDLLVASPTSGRNAAASRGLVGYFVNPVALRSDSSDDPTFEDQVAGASRSVIEALEHQDFPFPLVVERLQPKRDPSRPPLCQVMFVMEQARRAAERALAACLVGQAGVEMRVGALEMASLPLEPEGAQRELTLMVAEVEGRLAASLEYNRELFDATTARRMLEHFRTLLDGSIRQPSRRLSAQPLLTPGERHQLLLEDRPGRRVDPPEPLAEIFARQAARTPEAIAVIYSRSGAPRLGAPGRSVSYRELHRRAGRLAQHLRSLGVGAEWVVGVCLEPSIEAVVALLAVLEAGGAYLPIDPGWPPRRRASVLRQARAAMLLHRRGLAETAEERSIESVCLDDLGQILRCGRALAAQPPVPPESLAYVIYTSGSSGRPKGVGVPRRELARHLATVREAYRLGPRDRVLQFASLSFDVSLEQILAPLASGAALVLRGDEPWSPRTFWRRSRELHLSVVNLPAAFWHQVSREEQAPGAQLRLIILGGEAFAPATLGHWWRKNPASEATLLNAYGPTETTVTATTFRIPCVYRRALPRSIPLGRRLAGRTLEVLCRHGRPVPVGVPGEIHLGGAGLARGYRRQPTPTAVSFVPDPFGDRLGARLYRTGDLGRLLPDGNLEFLGRADRQLKVRGFRIEPEEVETVLRRHPEVREAVVTVRGEDASERRLVAFVSGDRSAEIFRAPAGELRSFLSSRLADYLVPSAFVWLDSLPATAGGKVDRAALDRLGIAAGHAPGAASEPPRTDLERAIADIWHEILGIEEIGAHDDFFELGGHSLLATRVLSRVHRAFGVELSLDGFFRARTVARLAAAVESEHGPGPELEPVAAGSFDDLEEGRL